MKIDAEISITTIILTFNEEKHIRRCLENVLMFSKKVYVIDSLSEDNTCEYCREYENVEVVAHEWPGNQAVQFNWFLDNHIIDTEWILRLDADEYLSDELIEEIHNKLPTLPEEVTGCFLKRDVIFMNKRIKYGKLRTTSLLRLWRNGKARIENRIMDEHTILTQGEAIVLKNYVFDDNHNGIEAWVKKHLDYADREMKMTIESSGATCEKFMPSRDNKKSKYYSLPAFHRAFWFFIFRYIFLGGFLDGKEGFVWNFMQCWWYRTLVDIKIEESSSQLVDRKTDE